MNRAVRCLLIVMAGGGMGMLRGTLGAVGGAGEPKAAGIEEIISYLETQNERGRAHGRLSYETDFVFTGGNTNDGVSRVIRDGDSEWHEIERRLDVTKPERIISRAVLTPAFYLDWPEQGNAFAYRFDHASIAEASAQEVAQRSFGMGVDVLMYGYGNGFRFFRDAVEGLTEGGQWMCGRGWDGTGSDVFVLVHSDAKDSQRARDGLKGAAYILDPAKGFLITRYLVFTNDDVGTDVRVTGTWVGAGFWFPTDVEDTRYTWQHGTKEPMLHRTMRTQHVMLDPVIAETQFTVAALGLDDRVKLLVKSAANSVSVLEKGASGMVPMNLPPAVAGSEEAGTTADRAPAGLHPVGENPVLAQHEDGGWKFMWILVGAGIVGAWLFWRKRGAVKGR